MLGVLEAKLVSDLANSQIGTRNPFFGNIDDFILNVFLGSHARFFYKVSEVIG